MVANVVAFFFFFFTTFLLVFIDKSQAQTNKTFPAIFAFGDSTVDSGNNNYIKTFFKANHRPYGEDFPGQLPSGRFCNGKLVSDMAASVLKIKDTVPPFLDPTLSNQQLVTGVNFASSGTGFDDLTSAGNKVIPMGKQARYFEKYIERLKRVVGEEEAKSIINSSLVVISAGTNDFDSSFYGSITRRIRYNASEYGDFLLQRLGSFVKDLYDLGSRKMVMCGLPPIGCLPFQITKSLKYPRTCLKDRNSDAQAYNGKLTTLLSKLQASLPGSKVLYANLYDPMSDMINNPQKYGFVETNKGCCGSGLFEAGPLCNSLSKICANASQYLFWDAFHLTETAYSYIAQSLVKQVLTNL